MQAVEAACLKALGPLIDATAAATDRASDRGDRGAIGQYEDNAAAFGESSPDGRGPLPGNEDLALFRSEVTDDAGFASLCRKRGLRVRGS
jgi:hypothetical protein